ncbi:MFS transporter [Desulforhopalus sp. IMCC35007]|uniref:MFS transporter n=1 Tax=Desulforhopalus sp. IMCC35007 TaxID=2569543 RepID=UPI0010AE589D|nr:MFS transporter [Desulforhopalus sp. IMCC35007]TKB06336.1 MFS transporter [Desulforhopalus sp. IMCC35007]
MQSLSERKEMKWFALLVVMAGVFLSTLDSGMVNIAIPTLMRYYRLPIEEAEQIVTIYLLTITITLVFWGRIADRKGLENIYLGGLLVFSMGAWLSFFSGGFSFLLFSRFIQGLGASMMMASGPALIKISFPVKNLGRNLGIVGIATACGLLTGPLVCGYLLNHFLWKSIFLLLGLVSLIVSLLGFLLFRSQLHHRTNLQPESFDWGGSFCWVAIVALGLNILQSVNQTGFIAFGIKLTVLILILVVFVHVERSTVHPILPLSLIGNRYYWVGVTTAGFSFLSLFSVLVLIPFYLDYVLHFSSKQIGLAMMAVPGTLVLLSPTAGFLYDKIGAKYLTSFGLLVSCLALAGLSGLSADSSVWWILSLLAAMGAGQSIFLSPNSASVLSKVGDGCIGATAGILATARNFGMVVGATLATVLFSYFSVNGLMLLSKSDVDTAQFVIAFGATLKCIAALSLSACLISLLRD